MRGDETATATAAFERALDSDAAVVTLTRTTAGAFLRVVDARGVSEVVASAPDDDPGTIASAPDDPGTVASAPDDDSGTVALPEGDTPALAVVLADGTLDGLSQPDRALLAEVAATDGCGVRTGAVASTVCATPRATTALDTAPRETVAVRDDAVAYGHYRDLFGRATPVTVGLPPRRRLLAAVRERVGPRAAAVVARESTRAVARGDGLDLACLCLWAGAATDASARRVIDAVADAGVVSHQSVERRLSRLREEGLLSTLPRRDGSPGRPDRRLTVAADVTDPARPPDWVRAALTR